MIIIKPLEYEDLKPIAEIRNQYIQFLRQSTPLNMEDQENWFSTTKDAYFSILDITEPTIPVDVVHRQVHKDIKLIGAVGATNIDMVHHKAEISMITEDYLIKEYADIGMDYIEKLAFEKLNLHKLFLTVYEWDEKKMEYFSDRYTQECYLREDVMYQGQFWKHYYFSLLENEWKAKL